MIRIEDEHWVFVFLRLSFILSGFKNDIIWYRGRSPLRAEDPDFKVNALQSCESTIQIFLSWCGRLYKMPSEGSWTKVSSKTSTRRRDGGHLTAKASSVISVLWARMRSKCSWKTSKQHRARDMIIMTTASATSTTTFRKMGAATHIKSSSTSMTALLVCGWHRSRFFTTQAFFVPRCALTNLVPSKIYAHVLTE